MIRATEVLPAGQWNKSAEADAIELPHDGRHRRRIAMRGNRDTVFLLDLAEAALLHDGDGLKLQDGRVVRVIAASEPIVEITASDPHHLARIAWHLGNRHVPAQILADRIRIGRDHVLEELMVKLGAKVSRIEAPFDPEGGAYTEETAHAHDHHHDHSHDHHHGHDHAHHHEHEHGPNCGCGHDHAHDHSHDHGHHHGHAHKR
ncbi:MAG: urease accessory protein UreE [Xanthobacteraceae bacterium]|nr:urease accessory protein UreE [Xanthobacteraceae bacterium]